MAKLMNSLTRLGIAVALVGGAANSMLYNGKQTRLSEETQLQQRCESLSFS